MNTPHFDTLISNLESLLNKDVLSHKETIILEKNLEALQKHLVSIQQQEVSELHHLQKDVEADLHLFSSHREYIARMGDFFKKFFPEKLHLEVLEEHEQTKKQDQESIAKIKKGLAKSSLT